MDAKPVSDLTTEREALIRARLDAHDWTDWDDVRRLLAEIDRLRAALKEIATDAEAGCQHTCTEAFTSRGRHATDCPRDFGNTAREALGPPPMGLPARRG